MFLRGLFDGQFFGETISDVYRANAQNSLYEVAKETELAIWVGGRFNGFDDSDL